jgi:uncharacterized protein
MNITLTGATGFIGRTLVTELLAAGNTVRILSRAGKNPFGPQVRVSSWDPAAAEPPGESLEGAEVIIHLAGEPVAQRWTPEVKRRIRDSRVNSTRHLVHALSTISRRPAALICGSATGIYGSRGDEMLTEASKPGSGFLAELCVEWEKEAELARSLGMRVACVRTGIVLGRNGGALAKMLPPFKAFVGGRIGSGRQWMSWIHLEDLVGVIRHSLEHPVQGPVNGTAPNPVTNADFTRELANALHRPAVFPVPEIALKAIFGEMSGVLLSSQRVLPKAAESSGFRFRFPELRPALEDVLR